MKDRCEKGCAFSRSIHQEYPRKCIYCGNKEIENGDKAMNQPRFKFGETVETSCGKVFIISDIRRDVEYNYVYNEDRSSGPCFAECEIDLYVPKKENEDAAKKDLRWALEKIMVMAIPSSNAYLDASRKLKMHFNEEANPIFK